MAWRIRSFQLRQKKSLTQRKIADRIGGVVERTAIQSSTIKAVGHDPRTLMLEIEFRDGNVYQYFGVPQKVHAELLKATSAGRFFNTAIKEQYGYVKL